MKIAIVHDWLYTYAGAEKVLEQLVNLYPQADLYSVVDFLPPLERGFIRNKPITTTIVQKLPFASKRFQAYLPLMPLAIEQLDLSEYDLILSSSYAVAKGVISGPDQLHISYVHSPMRYAWDLQHQYLRESGLEHGLRSWLVRYALHKLRMWDVRTATGVDYFVANSRFIARRIRKAYRRDAEVIYPPVDVEYFSLAPDKEEFYLTASRMVPYKRIDLIVEAFAEMRQKRLVVIGSGPEFERIKSRATGNVKLIGYQSISTLRSYMQRAKAFIFAAKEDFGIVSVEAQACGTPVIAYGRGGAVETVRGLELPSPTGILFDVQSCEAIRRAIDTFESNYEAFSPPEIRLHAEYFGESRFRDEMSTFVQKCWTDFINS